MAISTPDGTVSNWTLEGQGRLFDPYRFYDRAADPASSWNLIPGLDGDVASDDDVHDWGLLEGPNDGGSGWGVAS